MFSSSFSSSVSSRQPISSSKFMSCTMLSSDFASSRFFLIISRYSGIFFGNFLNIFIKPSFSFNPFNFLNSVPMHYIMKPAIPIYLRSMRATRNTTSFSTLVFFTPACCYIVFFYNLSLHQYSFICYSRIRQNKIKTEIEYVLYFFYTFICEALQLKIQCVR